MLTWCGRRSISKFRTPSSRIRKASSMKRSLFTSRSIKEFMTDITSKRCTGGFYAPMPAVESNCKVTLARRRFREQALRDLGCLAANVFHPLS